MIETFENMKHGKSNSYEKAALSRTANQILHHMEDKDNEDSLESTKARVLANARAIYGANRCLDVISFAPTLARKIGAAIVEYSATSRSFIHCISAKEDSRIAAFEHLLVITEDLLHRLIDAEGITSSGWLPATAQAQHAATYGVVNVSGSMVNGSATGSISASRRSSVAPENLSSDHLIEHGPSHPYSHLINDHNSPHSPHHIQSQRVIRNNSDSSFSNLAPQAPTQILPRRSSDVIQQPKPVPVGQFQGNRHGRVQWNLGSEG